MTIRRNLKVSLVALSLAGAAANATTSRQEPAT